MRPRVVLAVALVGATAFVPAVSAATCPPLTQPQNVYDPFTRQHIATICVPIQH